MENIRKTYQRPVNHLRRGAIMMLAMLLVSTLQAQSASRASEQISPEQSLRATNLSAFQFSAYSDRALEKIEEWLAYMNLLRESSGDSVLYAELVGYTQDLFLVADVPMRYGDRTMALEDWLWANRADEGGQVVVSRHEWAGDWSGQQRLFQRPITLNLSVAEGDSPKWAGEVTLMVFLTRIEKDFGGEKIETWEIRLGELQ